MRHFEWFSNTVSRAYLLLFLLKKGVVRRWCWSCRSKTQRLMLENFSSLLLFHYFSFIEFQSQLLKRDDDDANKGEKFSLVCCSSGFLKIWKPTASLLLLLCLTKAFKSHYSHDFHLRWRWWWCFQQPSGTFKRKIRPRGGTNKFLMHHGNGK